MSAWRRAAIEKLPSCRDFIQQEENIYQLWDDLWMVFAKAHEEGGRPHDVTVIMCATSKGWKTRGLSACFFHEITVDEQTIAQIASYASWCLRQPTRPVEIDPATAAIVDFWERLPTDPLVRQRLPEWLSAEDFTGMINIFRYFLSEEEHEQFLQEFYGKLGVSKEEQERLYEKSFGPKPESAG